MLKVIAGRNNNAAYVIPQGQYGVEQYNTYVQCIHLRTQKLHCVSKSSHHKLSVTLSNLKPIFNIFALLQNHMTLPTLP